MMGCNLPRMGAFPREKHIWLEVKEAADVFRYATLKSLVVMYELGRRTGTSDGAAIAFITLRQFACRLIFTTH